MGDPGCYVSTWGDGKSWQLVFAPEEPEDPEEEISPRQWTWFKRRLSFCEVTQDGERDGCFRLHRLPTAVEAEVIRDIIGIRKAYSPEELARRREVGLRLELFPVKIFIAAVLLLALTSFSHAAPQQEWFLIFDVWICDVHGCGEGKPP